MLSPTCRIQKNKTKLKVIDRDNSLQIAKGGRWDEEQEQKG